MKENVVKSKSFDFALLVIKSYRILCEEQREFVMSKQLLRAGTSVGAMVREAEHAESKADFIHKNAIAQKEVNESIYWIELLYAANLLSKQQFEELNNPAIELLKLLTSIIKTSKNSLTRPH